MNKQQPPPEQDDRKRYGPATQWESVGAWVGAVSCLRCGCALLLDDREKVNVLDLHNDWHDGLLARIRMDAIEFENETFAEYRARKLNAMRKLEADVASKERDDPGSIATGSTENVDDGAT